MKRKVLFVLVAIALILTLGLQFGFAKEKKIAEVDLEKIMRKLDSVLANQAEMLKQFTEIKQELDIIRVRASR